jgi:hypothetical protein
MNKEDIQKLIGGYATGSLTEEERLKLFEAALDDQELFDALQQEQTLKDLFDDPFSRDLVRRAVAESLPPLQTPSRRSWFRQPWIWASATSLAMAAVLVIALVRWDRTPPPTNRAATVRDRPQHVENRPTEPQPRPTTEAAGAPAGTPSAGKPLADKPPADKPIADHAKGLARHESRGSVAGAAAGTSGSRRNADSVQLAQNRESDLRDTVSPQAPSPSLDAPRKDDQVVVPPSRAPQPQNQLEQRQPGATTQLPLPSAPPRQIQIEQGRQAAAAPPQPLSPPPPQVQLERSQQQLRQSEQLQVRAQAPVVPPATAGPDSRAKTADEEKPRDVAANTETVTVEMKSARTSQPKSKALGNAVGLAKKAEPQQAAVYSFAKRADDGPFVEVPSDTVFRPGETIRVTIAPRISGPLSIWESDATNPEWRRLLPAADSKKVSLRARQDYAIPVDIVVQKDQKLRVTTGSAVMYISIRTENAPAK